jgi:hypothetical protein
MDMGATEMIGRNGHSRTAAGERGAVMMFVLLFLGLIAVVSVGVMQLVTADVAAGVRQIQAVRVFNIAEAGIHFAMARLQSTGATSYTGETVPITDGITGQSLGQATVRVRCLDAGSSTPPCSGGTEAYRRIVSEGTLPSGGPRRVVVAVVEGFPEGVGTYAICSYDTVTINQGITVYGDVGSNADISLAGPSGNYARIRNSAAAPSPYNSLSYAGDALAVGTVSCSQGCTLQVAGRAVSGAPGPVCPVVALPAFAPGATDISVVNPTTSYEIDASGADVALRNVTVGAAGSSAGCDGSTPFRDLVMRAGPAGTTRVVQMESLTMGRCARLIIEGAGNVEVRVAKTTGTAVQLGQYGRIGMLPTAPYGTLPVPAGRLTFRVRSTGRDPAAVQIDRSSVVTGAWHVPNGEVDLDRMVGVVGQFYGAILSNWTDIDRDFVFTYDSTALMGTTTYTNFSKLRSWKDQ